MFMNKWATWTAVITIGLGVAVGGFAQTFDFTPADSPEQTMAGGVRKPLSDRPFFGTESVLTLNGSYVNTPQEDYEQSGVWDVWDLPLSLDQMHGMIAEISFGGSDKQGQWQLTYRQKMMTMDSDWQSIAAANSSLSLSDSRSQVLKASYNVRDWWKVGVAAVVENRNGSEPTLDIGSFGLNNGDSLGFQIDTSLKF